MRLAALLCAAVALPAAAVEKTYQLDSFTGSGNAVIEGDFNAGEGAAVVFTPAPGDAPLTLKRVQVLVLPEGANPGGNLGAFLLGVWRDPGGGALQPGAQLLKDDPDAPRALTASLSGINDVVLDPPLAITSGAFRVGVFFTAKSNDPAMEMTLGADDAAIDAEHELLFAGNAWASAATYHVNHNFIIRAVCDVTGGSTTTSMPTLTGVLPSSGPPGATLNIAGTGFAAGAMATLDLDALDAVTVESATLVTAKVPASATPGVRALTVTNPDGGAATKGEAFTVTAAGAAPTLTSIAPDAGESGKATPVVVDGAGFVAGTIVRIGDLPLDGPSVTPPGRASGSVPALLPPGTYDVSATNPDGQRAVLAKAFVEAPAPAATPGGCRCGSTASLGREGSPGSAGATGWLALAAALVALRRRR